MLGGSLRIAASLMTTMFLLTLQSCSSFSDNDEFAMSDTDDTNFSWQYDSNSAEGHGYRYIKGQNPRNYTVQLAVGQNADVVDAKIMSSNIQCQPVHYYFKQGKDVQKGVTCGSFSSLAEANNFRSQLPSDLKTDVVAIYQWRTLQKRAVPY